MFLLMCFRCSVSNDEPPVKLGLVVFRDSENEKPGLGAIIRPALLFLFNHHCHDTTSHLQCNPSL